MARLQYDDLFERVVSFENLHTALGSAMVGKRGKPDVAAFEYDAENQLVRLEEELRAKEYRPGPYRSFLIFDPKKRLISAAPFRDRVVHHALCNVIEPIFERTFIGDSYASRVGKGTHKAVDRAQNLARRYRYVLQCDLRQFFPSVDHEILRGVLASKLADPDVLWLIDVILEGGEGVLEKQYSMVYFQDDDLLAVTRPRARCAARNRNDPANFNDNSGFRVVLSIASCRGSAKPCIVSAMVAGPSNEKPAPTGPGRVRFGAAAGRIRCVPRPAKARRGTPRPIMF